MQVILSVWHVSNNSLHPTVYPQLSSLLVHSGSQLQDTAADVFILFFLTLLAIHRSTIEWGQSFLKIMSVLVYVYCSESQMSPFLRPSEIVEFGDLLESWHEDPVSSIDTCE